MSDREQFEKIPEGWKLVPVEPTREMWLEGSKSTGMIEDIYKDMLEAAPTPPATQDWCARCGCGHDKLGYAHLESCPTQTPPAPEVEPVAWRIDYVMEGAKRRALCGHNAIVDYRDIDSGATVTPLYTHLPNDGLRKAAEELMARLDSGSNCYTEKENLRAELNKDKS